MAKKPLDKDDDLEKEPSKEKPKGVNKALIAFLLFIAIVLGVLAYIFASKSAEPTYRTKIEKIMFDKANKSPKFVITFPDREDIIKGSGIASILEKKEDVNKENIEKVIEEDNNEEAFSPQKVLSNIPHIGKLEPVDGHIPLKAIELNPSLTESVNDLTLPKISGSKKAWNEYGKVVPVAPNFFKVAVVFREMGMDSKFTETLGLGLNDNFSFSFSPYASNLEEQIKAARVQGHETFIDIVFTSKDFAYEDSGPMSISLEDGADDIKSRFHKMIAVKAPYSGVIFDSGRMNEDSTFGLKALMEETKKRGLALIDATDTNLLDNIKVPEIASKKADFIIGENLSTDEVNRLLLKAEEKALASGQVMVIVDPKPYLVFLVKNWVDTFSPQLTYEEMKEQNIEKMPRPFKLVPASMMVVE